MSGLRGSCVFGVAEDLFYEHRFVVSRRARTTNSPRGLIGAAARIDAEEITTTAGAGRRCQVAGADHPPAAAKSAAEPARGGHASPVFNIVAAPKVLPFHMGTPLAERPLLAV